MSPSPTPTTSILSLHPELVNFILSHVNLRDHVRFAAACRKLRHLALVLYPPLSKSIFHVPTNDPARLLEHYLGKSTRDGFLCVGAYQGWLAVAKLSRSGGVRITLHHPILRSRVAPPVLAPCDTTHKVVVSGDPNSRDCIVAVWFDDKKIALCDRYSWSSFALHEDEQVLDLAFHESLLWVAVATSLDCKVLLRAWDLRTGGPPLTSVRLRATPRMFSLVWSPCGRLYAAGPVHNDPLIRVWECGGIAGPGLVRRIDWKEK